MEGWIKLYRQFIDWEWYSDSNVKAVFLHLLLAANHEANNWQGKIVNRGQVVISSLKLAKILGLSRQQIRTALDKLKSTNEITTCSTNKYILVTINNYDKFQGEVLVTNQKSNQLENHQITTNKNDKNIILSYFINIYREKKPSTFFERMGFLHEIQDDEKYKELTPEEEHSLRVTVLGREE